MGSEYQADLMLKTRLERLLASPVSAQTWSDVEERARRMGWRPKEERPLALVPKSTARADARFRVSPPTPGAHWQVVPRRTSRVRVAVFASAAIVLVVAVAMGGFVAVRSLTHPDFILAITDETVTKPVGTEQTAPAASQWSRWQRLSLAGEGATDQEVWRLVPDPTSAEVLYASTPGGIYKSTNAGTTWNMILDGLGTVVVAPSVPSILYAWTSAGLFRSEDGGEHWTVLPGSGLLPAAEEWNPRLDGGGLLLVAPTDPDTVFADSNGLLRSSDAGSTWSRVPSAEGVMATPGDASVLYAVTSIPEATGSGAGPSQISKSTDMGATWTPLSPKQWTGHVEDVVVDPSRPLDIYVIYLSEGGFKALSRSSDGGTTWQDVPLEGAGRYFDLLRFDPHLSGGVYVLTSANGAGVSGTGLYWSTDRVDSWLDITEELTDTVVVDLVADPAPGGGLYVVTSNGLFRWIWTGHTAPPIIPQAPTTDGQGRVTGSARGSWQPLSSPQIPGASQPVFLGMDPTRPSTLYAKFYEGLDTPKFMRSDDGGRTWTDLSGAAPFANGGNLGGYMAAILCFDPSTTPAAVMTYFDSGYGLWRSEDRGETWTEPPDTDAHVDAILIDANTPPPLPDSSSDSARQALASFPADVPGGPGEALPDPLSANTLYVVADQVYRTTDGGATWQSMGDFRNIAVDPETGTLYAVKDFKRLYTWVPESD